MKKGSWNSDYSPPKVISSDFFPVEKTTIVKGAKGSGPGEASYQTKSRVSYGDKQSGSYGRATAMEKASSGEFCWKNGTSGVKNEHTRSSTVRVGDQSGYTEVSREERFRDVRFDKSSGSKNLVTGDYDLESDSDSDSQCGYDSKYSDSPCGYDSKYSHSPCGYDSESDSDY